VIQRLDLDQSAVTSPNSAGAAGPGGTFYQSRGFIWEDTMRMIRANWLTGVGLGAYQTVYPIYSQRDRFHLVGQAHNDYLQVLADGGIILGFLALLYLGLLLRYGIKAIDHPDPVLASLAVGCAGGIFALLVHSLFDFNLQIISNSLLFMTLSIVLWRIGYSAMNKRVSPGLLHQTSSVEAEPQNLLEMEVWS
jgi:O-antigen ligase